MAGKNMNKPITIVGYVDPVDGKNKESGIMITTEDNNEFIVELNKEGRRLMNMIDEKVKASGIVTKTKGGEGRISVDKFEVLEYEETYEDDQDYEAFEDIERFD